MWLDGPGLRLTGLTPLPLDSWWRAVSTAPDRASPTITDEPHTATEPPTLAAEADSARA
ncbi:hypothetical protein [Streptomyces sp. NBC_00582]|uniref:hypothetical protein n=1 Tax=Streptomyces sp. NBC_00582 TaxID=2975783 RepID=UPI002E804594|nr:hypothetical protein [Streptomyces sp. NBC_00582]WUB67479.1 hypothetical protein OG852_47375 [Streptomyces sp. NBC_00582]